MSQKQIITFDKGINRKKSPLLLSEGEVYTAKGFSFAKDGVLECRDAVSQNEAIDTDSNSTINAIHRNIDDIFASSKAYCPGDQAYFNYIYHRISSGSYSNIDLMGYHTRPRFADFKNFTFAVDSYSKKVFTGAHAYEWGVANPNAPVVTAGAGGNPDGTYNCYVTFYIIFPNGEVYETGPSAAASVTVSSEKIEWTNIPCSRYGGDALIIYRKLYRAVSGTTYYVTTINDNTTSTYSDNNTDATLQAAAAISTTGYDVPPDYCVDVAMHLQRMFLIKGNKLYWSEPYIPFGFISTSNVTVSRDEENLVALVPWSDQLYIASRYQWYRLQGSSASTWTIKRTFTDAGVINRHTVQKTRFGILGLYYDGIYLFDGATNKNLTEKYLGSGFFDDIYDLDECYGFFDGIKYYFYYPSGASGLDSCAVIDCTYYPDFRVYQEDLVATARDFYKESGTHYIGKSGYEYSISGTETISTEFLTGDLTFGDITKRKNLL